MKQLIGTCVNNPFSDLDELCRIIDLSEPISRKRFLSQCSIDEDTARLITQFPNDFEFFESKIKGNTISFYTWSCIEHFYI